MKFVRNSDGTECEVWHLSPQLFRTEYPDWLRLLVVKGRLVPLADGSGAVLRELPNSTETVRVGWGVYLHLEPVTDVLGVTPPEAMAARWSLPEGAGPVSAGTPPHAAMRRERDA